MIRAVRGDRNSLIERHHISWKLARRIEALNRRSVGVTRQVLEICRPESPAEMVLLDPEFLGSAETLDDEHLMRIVRSAAGIRAGSVPAMCVVRRRKGRVIALASEVAEPRDTGLVPAATGARLPLSLLGGTDPAELFSPHDVAKLKLIIVTSTNEDEKVTAIRQLALVPGEPAEKGAVMLTALSDESAKVRSEAAAALVNLGLTPDIAEAARALALGNESQRLLAAQRLYSLFATVAESEVGVLLALLVGSLADEDSAAVREELIGASRAVSGIVSRRKEHAAEMVRLLLDQVRTGIATLRRPLADALAELGNLAPDVVGELCWLELGRVRENSIRRFLLTVMSRIKLPKRLQKEVVVRAMEEILASPRPEEDCLELGSMLCCFPKESIGPMLDAIESASDAAKLYLIRLLDVLAARGEVSNAVVERLGWTFLRLLQVSEKNVRPAILLAESVHSPRLSAELRRELAREMLAGLPSYGSVRMLDAISTSIVRIGEPAIKPLFDLIDSDSKMRERTFAVRMLGNTVAALPKRRGMAAVINNALDETMKRIEDRNAPRSTIAAAMGKMCTNTLVSQRRIRKVADELTARIKNGPDAYGVLEGLGALVLNPATPLQVRLDVIQLFFDLLNSSLPDVETEETLVDEQRVYSFGGDVSAYTEMVPIVLRGLNNAFIGTEKPTIRQRIAAFLLEKWNEISSWETIWGPENLIVLLRVLGSIACHADTPMDTRLDIVDAISKRTNLMSVIETLGSIYRTKPVSKRLGAKARDLAWLLMERHLTKRSLPVEYRQACQMVLGIIGARTSLGSDPLLARRTRERIVGALFEGLRAGHTAAAGALAALKNCAALPSKVREDVAARLESFEVAHSEKVPFRPRI